MKKLSIVGALAIAAALGSQQQLFAWINSQFGVGLNWNWASGGNSIAHGLVWRDGQPYGPEFYHQFTGVPAYPHVPPTYVQPNIHHHHQPIVEEHSMHVHQPHIHHQQQVPYHPQPYRQPQAYAPSYQYQQPQTYQQPAAPPQAPAVTTYPPPVAAPSQTPAAPPAVAPQYTPPAAAPAAPGYSTSRYRSAYGTPWYAHPAPAH